MANVNAAKAISLPAGEDLRGNFAEVLTVNASGQVVKASESDVIVGALAEEPAVATVGTSVPVALVGGGGKLKMKADAAITAGDLIVPSATPGRVAGTTTPGANQTPIGIALESAVNGDLFEVLAMTAHAAVDVNAAKTVLLPAGEDLTGDVAEALSINDSGQVVKTSSATDVIVGSLVEEPAAATVGTLVKVALVGGGGKLEMKAGAAITVGNLIVASATSGRVAGVADIAALAANQMAVGIALEAATAGDIFEVLAMTIVGPTA